MQTIKVFWPDKFGLRQVTINAADFDPARHSLSASASSAADVPTPEPEPVSEPESTPEPVQEAVTPELDQPKSKTKKK